MRRLAPLALVVAIVAACSTVGAASDISSAPALVDIGAGLSSQSGLSATVYVGGLTNVAALAFDAGGRLWAATAAYSDEGKDAIYIVDHQGASPRKVLDELHTPLGLLWVGGTLYVSHAGGVTAYSGFDGTAFVKNKTILELSDGAGEPNGLALSPDGRIVLGISAPCDHCTPTDRYSGTVVSFLPDGSDLHVIASGIRAPIGLAYVPASRELLVTMNQRDDLGDATPGDWLGLVKDGQDWGFPDCYGQGGSACVGVPEPAAVLDRHAAVSGLAVLEGADNGSPVAALVAEWALGTVLRVDLTAGATSGTASSYVTGLKNPVPVLADSNGDLIVGDWTTGTIYLISGVRG